ncbi:MAG TPA: hypothetical protein VMU15_21715 [Anaeromyxobacter sp.]|nr:hypothetical protein [Anaeromyxobacter sp.]
MLTRSRIPGAGHCVNPYLGCAHDRSCCYAAPRKRFTGTRSPGASSSTPR